VITGTLEGVAEQTCTVNTYEAKTRLSELLKRVEGGEDIVICRNGKAIARLVPAEPKSREHLFGSAKGTFTLREDAFDPWPDDFLDSFEKPVEQS
jgi:prevent-host-death family protein